MSRERKTYPKEFKLMSVKFSNTRNDLSALAKRACYSTLAVAPLEEREYAGKQSNSFPGNGNVSLSATEQELAQLKKELRETQMEPDILKSFYGAMPVEVPIQRK